MQVPWLQTQSKAYRLWDLESKSVVIYRDVQFVESKLDDSWELVPQPQHRHVIGVKKQVPPDELDRTSRRNQTGWIKKVSRYRIRWIRKEFGRIRYEPTDRNILVNMFKRDR